MGKDILNAIAYQRYATQSLYNALRDKRDAALRADPVKRERFAALAANSARDIRKVKARLAAMLGGSVLRDMLVSPDKRGSDDARAAMAGEMLEDIARLEELCMHILAETKAHESACVLAGVFPQQNDCVTLQ